MSRSESKDPHPLLFAALLFAASLVIDLLFWKATPDGAWPYSVFYQGDAPVWLDYAAALRSGQLFEWGLPLRPPALGHLLAWIWDGSVGSIGALRLLWCLFGAGVPPLFFFAARPFGFSRAALTGTLIAISTSRIVLSNSLNVEIPYLVLIGLSLILFFEIKKKPRLLTLGAWSLLQGIGCLFRAEHLLFFAGSMLLFSIEGPLRGDGPSTRLATAGPLRRDGPRARLATADPGGRRLVRLAALIVPFVVVLLPWHLAIWSRIDQMNSRPLNLGEPIETWIRDSSRRTSGLTWKPDALRAVEELPGFGRSFWKAFVAEIAFHRNEREVGSGDVQALEEAFGCRIEPLARHPFVTLYGPLNFYLANNGLARGGFGREVLETPPPLTGGAGRYPAFFSKDFPPEDALAIWYPPHLDALNHGVRKALDWMGSHPGAALGLAGRKLAGAWAGAAPAFTGYGLPFGRDWVRRKVDIAVPAPSAGATLWRVALLVLCGVGVLANRRRRELHPWLVFLGAYTVVAVLFFGYARLGAMVSPVVALLLVLALFPPGGWGRRRLEPAPRRAALVCLGLLLLAVGAEAYRLAAPPRIYVRGRPIGVTDPYPMRLYVDQEIHVR